MRVTRNKALATAAAGAALCLAMQCTAPGRTASTPALTKAVPVTQAAMRGLATRLAANCVDSLPPGTIEELWPASDSPSGAAALGDLQKVLAACSCTVFGLKPATYEALAALTALPVSVLLVVVDYPISGTVPLSRERFTDGIPPAEDLDPGLLRLRLVGSVAKRGASCTVRCTDGQAVSGLPQEDPVGQVYLAATVDGEAYRQVAGVLCVTSLSRFSIEDHLEEWFRMMPRTRVAPRLTDPVRGAPKGADR